MALLALHEIQNEICALVLAVRTHAEEGHLGSRGEECTVHCLRSGWPATAVLELADIAHNGHVLRLGEKIVVGARQILLLLILPLLSVLARPCSLLHSLLPGFLLLPFFLQLN